MLGPADSRQDLTAGRVTESPNDDRKSEDVEGRAGLPRLLRQQPSGAARTEGPFVALSDGSRKPLRRSGCRPNRCGRDRLAGTRRKFRSRGDRIELAQRVS